MVSERVGSLADRADTPEARVDLGEDQGQAQWNTRAAAGEGTLSLLHQLDSVVNGALVDHGHMSAKRVVVADLRL